MAPQSKAAILSLSQKTVRLHGKTWDTQIYPVLRNRIEASDFG